MMPYADFFSGVIAMGFAVCAVFFLRYWTLNKDRLFLVFAIAFLLLAVNQALAAFLELALEERSWLYLLRLAAFGMIIFAIVRKNTK
jgi:hypothetical protein